MANSSSLNWGGIITNVVASSGTCIAGLGILINLILAPYDQRISTLEEKEKENKKIIESIHEMSKNMALLKKDFSYLIKNIESRNKAK
ncbi:unnamed protein product [marine sediment metagenome]|uniref:Uncharacterized protein n=1 Tax=marine sediment metagenome TaxID=412755 RepID=X0WJF8_9ZZZZ